jgi:hypothetical protein
VCAGVDQREFLGFRDRAGSGFHSREEVGAVRLSRGLCGIVHVSIHASSAAVTAVPDVSGRQQQTLAGSFSFK